jgi:hypothetical protein
MDQSPSPREDQQKAFCPYIKPAEGSIRELGSRRNTPILFLPTEVITAIFFLLRVPHWQAAAKYYRKEEKPDYLAWLCVAHVCHQWREMVLNQPLFWSHVNFSSFTSAGVTEILNRAKNVPLHFEARPLSSLWDAARFAAFTNELQARISHICYLGITAGYGPRLQGTLDGLVSPAPTLEYLSLSREGVVASDNRTYVPDTLFDGTAPRLSILELRNCDISWESPLLKSVTYLEIRSLSAKARPSLSVWLDVLEEMPQLKTLTLYSASPIAPAGSKLPSYIERTITLSSLEDFDISASVRECGLALAHLVLPALTHLGVRAEPWYPEGSESASDVQDVIQYLSQHTHGPQDTQPLRSVFICDTSGSIEIIAWTLPDINIELPSHISFIEPMPSARVAFTVSSMHRLAGSHVGLFHAAMATLPLDSIVTLTTDKSSVFDEQFWFRYAPGWPLLRRVFLAPTAACGFTGMLLGENGSLLLPLLTKIVLGNIGLGEYRTLRLCDTFIKRVEQGVPLETLDLRTCLTTSRAVELLSEIVIEVLPPEETLMTKGEAVSRNTEPGGDFIPDLTTDIGPWHDWDLDIDRYEYVIYWDCEY